MKTKLILATVLLLGMALENAPAFSQQSMYTGLPNVGETAPALSLMVRPRGTGTPRPRTLAHYRRQWLVIDFWGKYCTSCIQGFPKLEALRKKFEGKASFLLLGGNDPKYEAGIEQFYARFQKDMDLGFDTAFDTLSRRAYRIRTVPMTFVVSPDGVIRFRGVGSELSSKVLEALIAGSTIEKAALDPDYPAKRTFTDSLSAVPHRSSLSATLTKEITELRLDLSRGNWPKGFRSSPITLSRLYLLGHVGRARWRTTDPLYGHLWPAAVLELRDTSSFIAAKGFPKLTYDYRVDFQSGQVDSALVRQAIRMDLAHWFGFTATLEQREMPVLKLVTLDSAKAGLLLSSSRDPLMKGDATGYVFRAKKTDQLILVLSNYFQHSVLIDASGIGSAIDLDLNANMLSLPSISAALREKGLDLVPSTSPMQVLVLRDRQGP